MNETTARVLSFIASRDAGVKGAARVSVREIADAIDCSVITVRRSISTLTSKDMLVVSEHFHEDGGQARNSYELTALGALAAEAIDRMMP